MKLPVGIWISGWLVFLLLGSFHPPVSGAEEKVPTSVIVEDVMGRPGKPVMLKAQVLRDGILGSVPVGGEKISFQVQGKAVGTALTGGDGHAFLEFVTPMRGNQKVTAKVEASSRVQESDGVGTLASWERRRPILLVDLSALIKEEGNPRLPLPTLPFNLNFNALGEPETDAADVLHKLGKYYYNVLYLYRDPGASFVEAREWLRKHKFPVGFTKAIKPGPEALTELIEELKEGGWDNVNAGIGRAPDFAEVLVKNRIQVVILPEGDQDVEFPRRAKIVKNWKEVRRHL